MMEFRYWTTALNSGSFDNHVSAPKAFDGNHLSASWHDLTLRYSFDDNKNLDETQFVIQVQIKPIHYTGTRIYKW